MEIYVFVFGSHLFEFSLVVKATEPVGMFCLLTCVFFFFVYMTFACFMFIWEWKCHIWCLFSFSKLKTEFMLHFLNPKLILIQSFFLYSLFRASSFYINKIQQDATNAVIYYCQLTLHVSCVYRTNNPNKALIRPCWQKVVALICDMTCIRGCGCSLMYSWWWGR